MISVEQWRAVIGIYTRFRTNCANNNLYLYVARCEGRGLAHFIIVAIRMGTILYNIDTCILHHIVSTQMYVQYAYYNVQRSIICTSCHSHDIKQRSCYCTTQLHDYILYVLQ